MCSKFGSMLIDAPRRPSMCINFYIRLKNSGLASFRTTSTLVHLKNHPEMYLHPNQNHTNSTTSTNSTNLLPHLMSRPMDYVTLDRSQLPDSGWETGFVSVLLLYTQLIKVPIKVLSTHW